MTEETEFDRWAQCQQEWRSAMWRWTTAEKCRLDEVRRAYWRGEIRYSEDSLDERRLGFGRWLVEHGRISDG